MRPTRRPETRAEEPRFDQVVLGVAEDCGRFLDGTWASTRHAQDRHVPVWAWLNESAHGDAERLRRVAASADDHASVEDRTRATLARAVLVASEGTDLLSVQRAVLVPLELRLIGTVLTPRRLLELVGRALF